MAIEVGAQLGYAEHVQSIKTGFINFEVSIFPFVWFFLLGYYHCCGLILYDSIDIISSINLMKLKLNIFLMWLQPYN